MGKWSLLQAKKRQKRDTNVSKWDKKATRWFLVSPNLLHITDTTCPTAWRGSDSMCYRVSRNLTTWYGAVSRCKVLGGNLLTIHNLQEQNFIKSRSKWVAFRDCSKSSILPKKRNLRSFVLDPPPPHRNRPNVCHSLQTSW